MTTHAFKLLAVGVGGQGILSTVRLLGAAGMAAGLEVRVGQDHGLAQRGGSVEASLIVGPGASGFISRGEADIVLALEPLEAQRAIPRMNSETTVVIEPTCIVPYSLTSRGLSGPSIESVVVEVAKVTSRVLVVDASAAAREAGSAHSLNVAMLGVLSGLDILPIPAAAILSVAEGLGHSALGRVNLRAFELGCRLGSEAAASASCARRGEVAGR
ncbi:MAG: pyruvate ferredoxin oxidoreductase [bacterium]|nr:pyruvate ferredoxin oxidoreductase [bacterium]